jgi:hypothetical protein
VQLLHTGRHSGRWRDPESIVMFFNTQDASWSGSLSANMYDDDEWIPHHFRLRGSGMTMC